MKIELLKKEVKELIEQLQDVYVYYWRKNGNEDKIEKNQDLQAKLKEQLGFEDFNEQKNP